MENLYFRRPYSLKHEQGDFHRRHPDTGIIIGAEPFHFQGSNNEAVLMAHGYTSTPRDLRDLGGALNRLGYTASGILLPGHGTRPTDLDTITWQDWYAAFKAEYDRLQAKHRKVHAVGFSMGGALAMHLAAETAVHKLVLLSPLLKISYNPFHVLPEEWLVFTVGRLLRHLKKKHTGNCNDPEARRRHIAYYHYSLSSINQALALVEVVKGEVRKIHNKLLILHGRQDKTTSPLASRRLFDRIPAEDKRFIWLARSNHIITHDVDKERVFREVCRFLQER